MFEFLKSLFGSKEPNRRNRPLSDDEFNEIRSKRQKKLDNILDKISKYGQGSLSSEEKNFLNSYKL